MSFAKSKGFFKIMGHSQAVRHSTLTAALVGSNPTGPVVETPHVVRCFLELTASSVTRTDCRNPFRLTTICGYGGIGRHARFRFWSARVQVQVLLSAVAPKIKNLWSFLFYMLDYFTKKY